MAFVPKEDVVLCEKYRLVRRLARGGMGSVWLARHLSLDTEVAIKLIAAELVDTPEARSRFEREAKACAHLRSPHVVRVFDYGMHEGVPFMVMELLDGETLATRLERAGALSLREVTVLASQLAKALRVAHDAGIVHRDLKPSNVFFSREGDAEIVKLVDFGVARETRTILVDDPTHSGVVIGSPHQMSPEQARAEKVGPKSDVWSFGVLLYHSLVGQRPFTGDNLASVLLSVISAPIPSAHGARPSLPPSVDRILARALDRDTTTRIGDPGAIASALEAVAAGQDPEAFLAVEVDGPGRPTLPTGEPEPLTTDTAAAPPSVGRTAIQMPTGSIDLPMRSRAWWVIGAGAALAVIAAVTIAITVTRRPAETALTPSSASSSGATAVATSVAASASAPPTPFEVIPIGSGPSGLSPSAPTSSSAGPRTAAPPIVTGPRPKASAAPKACTNRDAFTGLCLDR